MRQLIFLFLALLLATPALAGDGHFRRHRDTGRYLSQSHIVGGRAVTSDYYRPYSRRSYGFGSSYRRPYSERIIIIERDYGTRRWR